MTIIQRIVREPVAIGGLLVATYGLLRAFGVLDLTREQYAAGVTFLGALVVALRWLVTPASEVVAQQKPDQVQPVAGPAADVATGAPVAVVPDL